MTKNVVDRERHKKANRIVKERITESKNRMWQIKYKEIDSMIEFAIDKSIAFSKEFME